MSTSFESSGLLKDSSRRNFLKLAGVLGTAAAFAGSLSACSPGGNPAPAGSAAAEGTGSIEAGISYQLSTGFDPMLSTGATPQAANLHIFEGLTELHPATRESYLALAKADPVKVDDTTYEVQLRDGAKFHNGEPVTTADVVFSFQRVMDPANKSLFAGFIPFIDSVSAKDDSTVQFKLKYPFPGFSSRISVIKVVPEAAVKADPAGFDLKPIGSGPYSLVSAVKEDRIVFKKFDDYNGKYPARVADMTWLLLADPAARVAAVPSRTQAIEDVPYLDVDQLAAKVDVESVQSFGLLFLMFNCASEKFADKRVRQALHYAIDTDAVISKALLGNATAASSYFQEGHPSYTKASTTYGFDAAKAKSLLAEAGMQDMTITLTSTDTGWVTRVVPLIKEYWDAIGVTTTLEILQSAAVYAPEKVGGKNFDVLCAPGDPSVFGNDGDILLSWFYRGATWMEGRAGWNTTPEYATVQQKLDQAVQVDGDKAKKLHAEVVDIVSEEAPLYPLFHRKLPTAWDSNALDGFQPLPTTGVSFIGVGRK
ncbi:MULTISPECIES: ABC transporter substrate-binding protein [unclassified Arthrobacter]|uniref:ABC transporter substrate-binding protein n=1 Tax=unclassified Arthrobacter TaxID=235627 RepID=UPI001D1428F8|nr:MULTISPECIES: ABC transporter substrate-binding protein [unclassified Arthrobacter]MCC3276295.1 ABC transporter substrate-binding protein [Arthrobacter sp. zg-Y20]MCC9178677.1 ABC transporter substrate-binding protein [Arthrobacter sp. zg-Y750]MDK1316454.1 ABC transporter substrate-binding protein [Arthrobacter sp. zg.Y20]WIB06499.1 ABC transporter substrate-binding protein [Arthrobacter sp. zg-Y20]